MTSTNASMSDMSLMTNMSDTTTAMLTNSTSLNDMETATFNLSSTTNSTLDSTITTMTSTTTEVITSTAAKVMTTVTDAVTTIMSSISSSVASPTAGTGGQEKTENNYKDPLIAMSVIACLLFLVLVVIFVCWWKRRGKTVYKTVDIKPKKMATTQKLPLSDVESQGQPSPKTSQEENGRSTEDVDLEMKEGVDNPTYHTNE